MKYERISQSYTWQVALQKLQEAIDNGCSYQGYITDTFEWAIEINEDGTYSVVNHRYSLQLNKDWANITYEKIPEAIKDLKIYSRKWEVVEQY